MWKMANLEQIEQLKAGILCLRVCVYFGAVCAVESVCLSAPYNAMRFIYIYRKYLQQQQQLPQQHRLIAAALAEAISQLQQLQQQSARPLRLGPTRSLAERLFFGVFWLDSDAVPG